MNQKVQEIYRRYDINPMVGCFKFVFDIGLLLLVYFTFRGYTPQLALDGAEFFWAASILDRDPGILIVWMVIGLFLFLMSPRIAHASVGSLFVQAVFGLGILAALAWFLSWPAWLLLFWGIVWACTTAVQVILVAFYAQKA